MKRIFLLLALICSSLAPPDQPAYQLFDQKGKTTTYAKLLRQAAEADVVLFGELHNNPICHWLQLQLTKDLYALKKERFMLAAEMFETDNQTALTDYVQGRSTDKEFAKQARLWPNYPTDYRPVVDFARVNKIPFVASNVPRRYASLVARQGLAALDTVSATTRALLPPLPLTVDLTLPGYVAMLDMMKNPAHSASTQGNSGMVDLAANFARAQAVKDASMAHFTLKNWQPGQTILHLNGDYHSKNFEGISWYLRQANPALRIFTISSVEVDKLTKPTTEQQKLANALLFIPADMTKTY